MPEAFALVPVTLPTVAWSAGQPVQVPFQNLQALIDGAVAHTVYLDVELNLDPSYTTAPTNVGHNAAVSEVLINDGEVQLLSGVGFNGQRLFERGFHGGLVLPDPLTQGGTGNPRCIRRRFFFGPPNMLFAPTDFAKPNALLSNGGFIQFRCGALTDISADCTAATGDVTVTAWQALLLDEVRIPPRVEFKIENYLTGQNLTQAALYAFFAFINSSSYDAIGAGDFGDIEVKTGIGSPFSAVPVEAITAAFQADFARGQFDGVMGEPRDATYDVAMRQANLGSPTAIAAQPADVQVLTWPSKDARITKLPWLVPNNLTVRFSGSNTTTQAAYCRFLPLDNNDRAKTLSKVMAKLPGRVASAINVRLGSKKTTYGGDRLAFLPHRAKLDRTPFVKVG